MDFDFRTLAPKQVYNVLVSSVMPRPIALTTTVNGAGRVNAAPFSFFNVVSTHPPLIALGIEVEAGKPPKDTSRNIKATGEFVVNLVDEALVEAMNVCATDYPPDCNELNEAGLQTEPSEVVMPPRIAFSPVCFECVSYHTLDLGEGRAVQIGRVVYVRVRDDLVLDAAKAYLDGAAMKLVGRMHGRASYVRTTDMFELKRLARPVAGIEAP